MIIVSAHVTSSGLVICRRLSLPIAGGCEKFGQRRYVTASASLSPEDAVVHHMATDCLALTL